MKLKNKSLNAKFNDYFFFNFLALLPNCYFSKRDWALDHVSTLSFEVRFYFPYFLRS